MKPYFSTPERISELRVHADKWLDTPFRDHWRAQGKGVDCIQLAVAIYTSSGLLNSFTSPPYSIGAWKGLRESPVAQWIDSSPHFEKLAETDTFQPGDLLCFAQGRVAYHLGIYLDEGSQLFIHAISVDGTCKRSLHDPTWAKRLTATYRPVET